MMSAALFGNRGNLQQHSGDDESTMLALKLPAYKSGNGATHTLTAALNHDIRHINIMDIYTYTTYNS